MEYQFVLCLIWTSFITISSTYGSDRECADSRNDCYMFSSPCSTAHAFIINGCPKTCGLCPVNGVNKEKSFKPTFYISSSIENGENITVKENQTVNFTCKNNSTTKVTLHLSKGRELIISHHNLTETIIDETDGNSSLTHTIKGVQCSDAGEYTCQALGFHGTHTSTATLSVMCDDDSCKDGGECIQSGNNGANQTPSLHSIPQMDSLYRPFPVTEIVGVLVTVIVTTVVLMLVKHYREHCQHTGPASQTEPRQIMDSVTELSVNGNIGHTYDHCDVILDACAKESFTKMPVTTDDDHITVAKGVDIPVAEDGLMHVAGDALIPVAVDGGITVAKDGLIYAELNFDDTQPGDSHSPPMPHGTEYTVIDFTNIKMKRNESK